QKRTPLQANPLAPPSLTPKNKRRSAKTSKSTVESSTWRTWRKLPKSPAKCSRSAQRCCGCGRSTLRGARMITGSNVTLGLKFTGLTWMTRMRGQRGRRSRWKNGWRRRLRRRRWWN
ncbi:hypothetical protein HK104_011179, partial [Borealophlyctis nickersoniae]